MNKGRSNISAITNCQLAFATKLQVNGYPEAVLVVELKVVVIGAIVADVGS